MSDAAQHSRYRDARLRAALREHRASIKASPEARRTLEAVETRLTYVLRVVEAWDETHRRRAEELLALGNTQAAALEAALIFDQDVRHSIYDRCPLLGDGGAAERVAANIEAGRQVLDV